MNLVHTALELPAGVAAIAALAAVVGRWSPWLLAATVVAALPGPLAHVVQTRARLFLERENTAAERLRGYYKDLLTSREAAEEVRAYDLGDLLLRRWRDLFFMVADAVHRQDRAQNLARAGLSGLSATGLAAGMAVAAWGAASGVLDAGTFAAMIVALQELQAEVGGLMNNLAYAGGEAFKLGDLFVYLELGPEEPGGGQAPPAGGDIVLEDVSFRYPQRSEPALDGIRLTLRRGERVALVGENGSGKTTLVKVLIGLFHPTAGRVLYGGLDLAGLDPRAVRAGLAAVFQDHVRYAFTLGENVAYGRAERMHDAAAVAAAVEFEAIGVRPRQDFRPEDHSIAR